MRVLFGHLEVKSYRLISVLVPCRVSASHSLLLT